MKTIIVLIDLSFSFNNNKMKNNIINLIKLMANLLIQKSDGIAMFEEDDLTYLI